MNPLDALKAHASLVTLHDYARAADAIRKTEGADASAAISDIAFSNQMLNETDANVMVRAVRDLARLCSASWVGDPAPESIACGHISRAIVHMLLLASGAGVSFSAISKSVREEFCRTVEEMER